MRTAAVTEFIRTYSCDHCHAAAVIRDGRVTVDHQPACPRSKGLTAETENAA